MASRRAGKMPAFFLDYDGTLTPIVDNPFEAKLSEEARAAPDLPLISA